MDRHEEKIRATVKRNKKIITFTTLVGLICPATLGTIQALADETAPQQTELQPQTANALTEPTNETANQDQTMTESSRQTPATPEPSPAQNEVNQPEQTIPTETAQKTQVTENTVTAETSATTKQPEEQALASEEPAKIEVQSFEAEEASFSSYVGQIATILNQTDMLIITSHHRERYHDLYARWSNVSATANETPTSAKDQTYYDKWLAELQNILNEANQLKTEVDASQTAEIYTYYVVRNVVDDNGNIVDSTRYSETAVKDSTIEVSAVNWYGYYLLPGTPNKYSAQITQDEIQEFVFTYMSATSQKHRDPVKEKQISDLFDELGDLHWELKLKSEGTQYAEPLQELWYRMDIVSASVGMFMQSHGYLAWYDYALSNLPAILADMKALAVEINASQPEESFKAGELDLVNARKIMDQYDSLDPYDYTEESWNKMIELDTLGEIYGASGSLRTLCDYSDNQIIKGSKDKIQQNVYEWTNRLAEAMKVLVKVGSGETPLQQSIAKLKRTITNAESKLEEASAYTPESMKALRSALQTAKDVLANSNSTKVEIDKALSNLNTAMANLKKTDDNDGINGGNDNNQDGNGNNGDNNNNQGGNSNGTNDNSGANNNTGNNSSNKTNITNVNNKTNQASSNNSKKDKLPQTGDTITNSLFAGLSMVGLSAIAWIKRKRKA